MPTAKTDGTLLVCNCQRSMDIDGARLATALSQGQPLPVHTELCRAGIKAFEAAVAGGGSVHVACTQEAPLFREIAEERRADSVSLHFTNIRERAGWCQSKSAAMPKMAALLAEAAYRTQPTGLMTLKSDGVCLIYGAGETVMAAARDLATRLSVTVLLTDPADALPPASAVATIARGRIRMLKGHLGAFDLEIDGYAATLPSSRRTLEFAMPRNGVRSKCDLVLDLSGGTALIADTRRDGYLRASPSDPVALARALLKASDLVGEFEKPLYVGYDAAICAHARSQKVGCSNCLDVCPTGAITPDGDGVAIDPAVCGGCGSCSAVCPTGAASFAYPPREDVIGRVQRLLSTYARAGGKRPVLLVHDEEHGAPLIDAMARLGRGMPPNVLPFSLFSVIQLGHDLMAGMLAVGADQVVILAPPEKPDELAPLERQVALAATFTSALGYTGNRIAVIGERDPDIVETALHELEALPALVAQSFPTSANKRELARIVLAKLNEQAPAPQQMIALPKGSPYGRLKINVEGCTLCLSCVGACPANALSDNPDRPQLSFTEAACVQCGICVATCPEQVLSLEPRYDFTPAALSPQVLKAEEPFLCIACGKPFGAKSSITKVMERLKGHAMFRGPEQFALIQMCDTCRVVKLAERGNDPMRGADRPRIRTTDDYLAADAEAKKTGRKPDDFLS